MEEDCPLRVTLEGKFLALFSPLYTEPYTYKTYCSISIPDIRNMSVWFTVNAYDQLDIDLPFQEAQTISLSGNITGYVAILVIHQHSFINTEDQVSNFQILRPSIHS